MTSAVILKTNARLVQVRAAWDAAARPKYKKQEYKSTPMQVVLSRDVLANKRFELCLQVLRFTLGLVLRERLQEGFGRLFQNDGMKTNGD